MIIQNHFKEFKKFNNYFLIYLSFLAFCAIIHLYTKHDVGNDSSISEWIINYQGGFTRRGLIGEVCFQLARIFDLELRYMIFLLQSILYFFFSVLLLIYIRNFKVNRLIIFALFSPLFLLYPIAEVEVLARKEIFLYIGFIIFLQLSNVHYSKNSSLIYIFFVYPILCFLYKAPQQFLNFLPVASHFSFLEIFSSFLCISKHFGSLDVSFFNGLEIFSLGS